MQYDKILSIPFSDRIPELIKQEEGLTRISAVLTAVIKSALENINLRYALTEDQLIETSFMIIEQASEDFLALEDVMLFLKELVLGQMGDIFSRMDIPTFFSMFEKYRQERHVQYLRIKEEQTIQHKALPVNDTLRDMFGETEKEKIHDSVLQHLKTADPNAPKYDRWGNELEK